MVVPTILHIETSTNVCSVALSNGDACLFSKLNDEGLNHAALLNLFIEEALNTLESKKLKLNAVAVSGGPGSYTGLRIGVSTAKGLCYGLDIPLIALDTLAIMTESVLLSEESDLLFCPMIDARRMEVYAAFYRKDGSIFRSISADIIDSDSYAEILSENTVCFFGNGAAKCKSVLTHSNAHFLDGVVPLATQMIRLANNAFEVKKFVDVAYYEPFYLKDFQPTTPKAI